MSTATGDASASIALNLLAHNLIQNTIARYAIALDTKKFDHLKEVFTEDVETIYPFKGEIHGVQNVIDAISKRLAPVTTQHALTTQVIVVQDNDKTAAATTYFTGIHFGRGKWAGQQVTAWGKYVDQLVAVDPVEARQGAAGQWLIRKREVIFMGRLGEEGVMEGE